ncbi:MAG: hypothetical protein R3179_05345, partial [Sedimenticolaceae bacterium]|nr:hypothetical protein [Sedimenticolaceae bacterium]
MTHKQLRSLPVFLLALLLVFAPVSLLAQPGEAPAQETETATPPESESPEAGLKSALEEIRSLEAKVNETAAVYLKSEGEEREQAWGELHQLEKAIDAELDKIVGFFAAMEEQGLDTSALKADVEKVLVNDQKTLRQEIDDVMARLDDLSKEREIADAAEKVRILQSAEEASKSLGVMFNAMLSNTERKEVIGLDTAEDLQQLDALLVAWADKLAARLTLINKEKDAAELAHKRAAEGDKEALKSEL